MFVSCYYVQVVTIRRPNKNGRCSGGAAEKSHNPSSSSTDSIRPKNLLKRKASEMKASAISREIKYANECWRDRLRRSVPREIRPAGSIRRIAIEKLKEHTAGEWTNPAGPGGGSRRKKRPWSEWRPGFGNMAERRAHGFNIGGGFGTRTRHGNATERSTLARSRTVGTVCTFHTRLLLL